MTSALYIQTRKEVRALLPWSIAVALTTVALASLAAQHASFPNFRYDQQVWTVVVYAAGLLTIAGLSMGQEIIHRTLPSLLMQPVDRRRLLWTKLAVLAAIAATMALIVSAMLPTSFPWLSRGPRLLLLWGPAVVAVGLVPLLTLLTRKPLGGVVFSITIPGVMLVVTEWLTPALDELHAATIAWYGTLIASGCGLAALAYLFPRIEAAGDDVVPMSRKMRLRAQEDTSAIDVRTAPAKRHWMWFALLNELRLQQLTFVVSALFVLLGAVIVALQRADPPYAGPGIGALATIHGLFIAIIAGSRASAEERHLGILATQALQPKRAWQMWTTKVTITTFLALALSAALPWLFAFVNADAVRRGVYEINPAMWRLGLERDYFLGVGLTAFASIYVSSLSSNSLWALLACFPTAVAGAAVFGVVVAPVQQWALRGYVDAALALIRPEMRADYHHPVWQIVHAKLELLRFVENTSSLILLIGLSLLVLHLAGRNHRSLERSRTVIARQVGAIALYLAMVTLLSVAAVRIAWWF